MAYDLFAFSRESARTTATSPIEIRNKMMARPNSAVRWVPEA
jgi:hypothetical protein